MMLMRRLLILTLALLLALSLAACSTGENGDETTGGSGGAETTDPSTGETTEDPNAGGGTAGGAGTEREWKNYSGVSVMSGDCSISPFSGIVSSYTEYIENGESMVVQGCGEGAYSILRDPIETFPTLIRSGDVTVNLPQNGTLERVDLVDMKDPERVRTETTLKALSGLRAGEYCVVLLIHTETEDKVSQEKNSTDCEDVFRLVVEEESYTETKVNVGAFTDERDGVSFRVDFFTVPRPWYGERIEGTLTYTNNTVTELSRYVHAFVDAGFRLDQGELSYESAPRNEMSESYGTVMEDAPLLVTIAPGETVTVNFSVEVPSDIFENDLVYFLTFALADSDTYRGSNVICDFYFRVH